MDRKGLAVARKRFSGQFVCLFVALMFFSGIFVSIAKAEYQEGGPEVLKVKGFYLGMDIDEACELLLNLSQTYYAKPPYTLLNPPPERYKVMGPDGFDGTYWIGVERPKYIAGPETWKVPKEWHNIKSGYFKASEDGKVCYVYIGSSLINNLFNTSAIGAEEFARLFIGAYDIPVMEPFTGEGNYALHVWEGDNLEKTYGWEFNSSKGYRVKIFGDKSLLIEQIPKKSELNFD